MTALTTTEAQAALATTATVTVDKGALKAATKLLIEGKAEEHVKMLVDGLYGEGAFAKVLAYQDEEKDKIAEQATAQARITYQARVKASTLITMPPEEMRGYKLIVEWAKDAETLSTPSVSVVRIKAGATSSTSEGPQGTGNGGGGSKGSIVKVENPVIGPPATFLFEDPTSYRKLNVMLTALADQNGWPIGNQADCEYAPHFKSKYGAHGWIVTLADGTKVSS